MKKIIFLISTIFLLLSNESKSVCPPPAEERSCFDADYECQNNQATWWQAVENITLPEWPNCTLQVHYCWRQCAQSPHYSQYYIESVIVLDNGCPDCQNLKAYFNVSEPDLSQHFRHYMNEVFYSLSEKLFWKFYNPLSSQDKAEYNCPTNPSGGIDWDNVRYKVVTFRGTCLSWCKVSQPVGYYDNFITTSRTCIPNNCCKIKIAYCIDAQTGVLHSTRYFISDPNPPNCEGTPRPLTCPEGVEVIQTDCKSNCGPE